MFVATSFEKAQAKYGQGKAEKDEDDEDFDPKKRGILLDREVVGKVCAGARAGVLLHSLRACLSIEKLE